jgi:hypothetical protein
MSGIFLSYSRADRALADQVVRSLRALGAEVWWDEDMPGVNWQRELARQIHQLAAVLVIWSPTSVASDSVADEARLAKSERKLVNALSRTKEPPFPFEAINGLPLDGWTGREPHNGWTRLVRTLDDLLAQPGAPPRAVKSAPLRKPSRPRRALTRRPARRPRRRTRRCRPPTPRCGACSTSTAAPP